MSKPANLDIPAILERMKVAAGTSTDAQLAKRLDVSNKTISSWRSRNSLPIEAVLQVAEETGKQVDDFLFGEARRPMPVDDFVRLFQFDDLRIKDFEIAGISIISSVLGQFAEEELAFMSEEDLAAHGRSLGLSLLRTLALIRHERKSLLDSGKLDEATFDEYARKAFRADLTNHGLAFEK